jgi:glycosyltransferase involved in cell wall biosynthesis
MPSAPLHVEPGASQEIPVLTDAAHRAGPDVVMPLLVSVVIEGYNEITLSTSVSDTLLALREQDYPLDRIEVILVTDLSRYRDWSDVADGQLGFHRVAVVPAPPEAGYFEMKNLGAARATGDIIAFVDSDVHPHVGWASAIVRGIASGADAVAGVSTFWTRGRQPIPAAVLEAAASVSWGHIPGRAGAGRTPAAALVAHNFAGRAETIRAMPFGTCYRRNTSNSRLLGDLRGSGRRVDFLAGQRVDHVFAPRWWLVTLHVRVGWEQHVARRIDDTRANRVVRRTSVLEPFIVAGWALAADARAWLRFGRALGHGPAARAARWPLVAAASLCARAAGIVGEFAAMVAPERSRAWAERQ